MKKRGFTLVELLAVIVILAIILVIAVPKIMDTINDARLGSIESSTKMLVSAAETDYAVRMASSKATVSVYTGTSDTSSTAALSTLADINGTDYDLANSKLKLDDSGKVTGVKLLGASGGKFAGYRCGLANSKVACCKDAGTTACTKDASENTINFAS